MHYICPICASTLSLTERTFTCDNRHSFDLAKEGYVNLMPANHKRSKNPGDSKEMMQARREFLATDHYAKLRDTLAKTVNESIEAQNMTLLDIGCGEGYYTEGIRNTLPSSAIVYGLDISKVAIRYAAKRYTKCHFSVASSYRLPFANNSLDAIIKIYAPASEEELLRCLKPNGLLISVTPNERHLYQLRERIYQTVRPHQNETEKFSQLTLIKQTPLHYSMQLTQGTALTLLQMTPFAWKASSALRSELAQTETFKCEADFMISQYSKIRS